jgi:glucokinase
VPSPPPRRVGVDIGGTSVKLGALGPAGEVLDERSLALSSVGSLPAALDGIASAVRELAPELDGLGVGMPGLLDRASGAVIESPNLPLFRGVRLCAELARRLDLSPAAVALENDANAAALGEAALGAARGACNALVVTLGTGVGGGLILGGEIFVGEGLAGEVGHVVVDPAGPRCGCGSRGCLETLASANAARRRARALGLGEDLAQLAAGARAGGRAERDFFASVGLDLGRGLAAVVSLLDVRLFVFSGGFSSALDLLAGGIAAGLSEWSYGARVSPPRLLPAALGPAAGWIGAALLPRSAPSDPARP